MSEEELLWQNLYDYYISLGYEEDSALTMADLWMERYG